MLLCTWATLRASHSRRCKGAAAVCFALLIKGFPTPAFLEQGTVRHPCAMWNNPQAARTCTLVWCHCSRIATHQMQNSPDEWASKLTCVHKSLQNPAGCSSAQTSLQQTWLGACSQATGPVRQGCSPSTSMQRQSATFRVEVVVGSARLLIPCGQGERTVAWLLQQVEKRLSSSRQVCAAVHTLMGWLMAVMWLPEAAS